VAQGQLDVASEKLQSLINEDPRDFRSHLCQVLFDILLSLICPEIPFVLTLNVHFAWLWCWFCRALCMHF
jgi:hypothetical protein